MAIEFKAPWILPDGESAESQFKLEPGAAGWHLYKREHGGEEWYRVPPTLHAQVQHFRRRESRY